MKYYFAACATIIGAYSKIFSERDSRIIGSFELLLIPDEGSDFAERRDSGDDNPTEW